MPIVTRANFSSAGPVIDYFLFIAQITQIGANDWPKLRILCPNRRNHDQKGSREQTAAANYDPSN
jgi:hypothetical protein